MSDSTSVRVELQYTRNLGNYESLKILVGVEDFVRTGETVDAATERVYEFVENKVIEKVQEMETELSGNTKQRK